MSFAVQVPVVKKTKAAEAVQAAVRTVVATPAAQHVTAEHLTPLCYAFAKELGVAGWGKPTTSGHAAAANAARECLPCPATLGEPPAPPPGHGADGPLARPEDLARSADRIVSWLAVMLRDLTAAADGDRHEEAAAKAAALRSSLACECVAGLVTTACAVRLTGSFVRKETTADADTPPAQHHVHPRFLVDAVGAACAELGLAELVTAAYTAYLRCPAVPGHVVGVALATLRCSVLAAPPPGSGPELAAAQRFQGRLEHAFPTLTDEQHVRLLRGAWLRLRPTPGSAALGPATVDPQRPSSAGESPVPVVTLPAVVPRDLVSEAALLCFAARVARSPLSLLPTAEYVTKVARLVGTDPIKAPGSAAGAAQVAGLVQLVLALCGAVSQRRAVVSPVTSGGLFRDESEATVVKDAVLQLHRCVTHCRVLLTGAPALPAQLDGGDAALPPTAVSHVAVAVSKRLLLCRDYDAPRDAGTAERASCIGTLVGDATCGVHEPMALLLELLGDGFGTRRPAPPPKVEAPPSTARAAVIAQQQETAQPAPHHEHGFGLGRLASAVGASATSVASVLRRAADHTGRPASPDRLALSSSVRYGDQRAGYHATYAAMPTTEVLSAEAAVAHHTLWPAPVGASCVAHGVATDVAAIAVEALVSAAGAAHHSLDIATAGATATEPCLALDVVPAAVRMLRRRLWCGVDELCLPCPTATAPAPSGLQAYRVLTPPPQPPATDHSVPPSATQEQLQALAGAVGRAAATGPQSDLIDLLAHCYTPSGAAGGSGAAGAAETDPAASGVQRAAVPPGDEFAKVASLLYRELPLPTLLRAARLWCAVRPQQFVAPAREVAALHYESLANPTPEYARRLHLDTTAAALVPTDGRVALEKPPMRRRGSSLHSDTAAGSHTGGTYAEEGGVLEFFDAVLLLVSFDKDIELRLTHHCLDLLRSTRVTPRLVGEHTLRVLCRHPACGGVLREWLARDAPPTPTAPLLRAVVVASHVALRFAPWQAPEWLACGLVLLRQLLARFPQATRAAAAAAVKQRAAHGARPRGSSLSASQRDAPDAAGSLPIATTPFPTVAADAGSGGGDTETDEAALLALTPQLETSLAFEEVAAAIRLVAECLAADPSLPSAGLTAIVKYFVRPPPTQPQQVPVPPPLVCVEWVARCLVAGSARHRVEAALKAEDGLKTLPAFAAAASRTAGPLQPTPPPLLPLPAVNRYLQFAQRTTDCDTVSNGSFSPLRGGGVVGAEPFKEPEGPLAFPCLIDAYRQWFWQQLQQTHLAHYRSGSGSTNVAGANTGRGGRGAGPGTPLPSIPTPIMAVDGASEGGGRFPSVLMPPLSGAEEVGDSHASDVPELRVSEPSMSTPVSGPAATPSTPLPPLHQGNRLQVGTPRHADAPLAPKAEPPAELKHKEHHFHHHGSLVHPYGAPLPETARAVVPKLLDTLPAFEGSVCFLPLRTAALTLLRRSGPSTSLEALAQWAIARQDGTVLAALHPIRRVREHLASAIDTAALASTDNASQCGSPTDASASPAADAPPAVDAACINFWEPLLRGPDAALIEQPLALPTRIPPAVALRLQRGAVTAAPPRGASSPDFASPPPDPDLGASGRLQAPSVVEGGSGASMALECFGGNTPPMFPLPAQATPTPVSLPLPAAAISASVADEEEALCTLGRLTTELLEQTSMTAGGSSVFVAVSSGEHGTFVDADFDDDDTPHPMEAVTQVMGTPHITARGGAQPDRRVEGLSTPSATGGTRKAAKGLCGPPPRPHCRLHGAGCFNLEPKDPRLASQAGALGEAVTLTAWLRYSATTHSRLSVVLLRMPCCHLRFAVSHDAVFVEDATEGASTAVVPMCTSRVFGLAPGRWFHLTVAVAPAPPSAPSVGAVASAIARLGGDTPVVSGAEAKTTKPHRAMVVATVAVNGAFVGKAQLETMQHPKGAPHRPLHAQVGFVGREDAACVVSVAGVELFDAPLSTAEVAFVMGRPLLRSSSTLSDIGVRLVRLGVDCDAAAQHDRVAKHQVAAVPGTAAVTSVARSFACADGREPPNLEAVYDAATLANPRTKHQALVRASSELSNTVARSAWGANVTGRSASAVPTTLFTLRDFFGFRGGLELVLSWLRDAVNSGSSDAMLRVLRLAHCVAVAACTAPSVRDGTFVSRIARVLEPTVIDTACAEVLLSFVADAPFGTAALVRDLHSAVRFVGSPAVWFHSEEDAAVRFFTCVAGLFSRRDNHFAARNASFVRDGRLFERLLHTAAQLADHHTELVVAAATKAAAALLDAAHHVATPARSVEVATEDLTGHVQCIATLAASLCPVDVGAAEPVTHAILPQFSSVKARAFVPAALRLLLSVLGPTHRDPALPPDAAPSIVASVISVPWVSVFTTPAASPKATLSAHRVLLRVAEKDHRLRDAALGAVVSLTTCFGGSDRDAFDEPLMQLVVEALGTPLAPGDMRPVARQVDDAVHAAAKHTPCPLAVELLGAALAAALRPALLPLASPGPPEDPAEESEHETARPGAGVRGPGTLDASISMTRTPGLPPVPFAPVPSQVSGPSEALGIAGGTEAPSVAPSTAGVTATRSAAKAPQRSRQNSMVLRIIAPDDGGRDATASGLLRCLQWVARALTAAPAFAAACVASDAMHYLAAQLVAVAGRDALQLLEDDERMCHLAAAGRTFAQELAQQDATPAPTTDATAPVVPVDPTSPRRVRETAVTFPENLAAPVARPSGMRPISSTLTCDFSELSCDDDGGDLGSRTASYFDNDFVFDAAEPDVLGSFTDRTHRRVPSAARTADTSSSRGSSPPPVLPGASTTTSQSVTPPPEDFGDVELSFADAVEAPLPLRRGALSCVVALLHGSARLGDRSALARRRHYGATGALCWRIGNGREREVAACCGIALRMALGAWSLPAPTADHTTPMMRTGSGHFDTAATLVESFRHPATPTAAHAPPKKLVLGHLPVLITPQQTSSPTPHDATSAVAVAANVAGFVEFAADSVGLERMDSSVAFVALRPLAGHAPAGAYRAALGTLYGRDRSLRVLSTVAHVVSLLAREVVIPPNIGLALWRTACGYLSSPTPVPGQRAAAHRLLHGVFSAAGRSVELQTAIKAACRAVRPKAPEAKTAAAATDGGSGQSTESPVSDAPVLVSEPALSNDGTAATAGTSTASATTRPRERGAVTGDELYSRFMTFREDDPDAERDFERWFLAPAQLELLTAVLDGEPLRALRHLQKAAATVPADRAPSPLRPCPVSPLHYFDTLTSGSVTPIVVVDHHAALPVLRGIARLRTFTASGGVRFDSSGNAVPFIARQPFDPAPGGAWVREQERACDDDDCSLLARHIPPMASRCAPWPATCRTFATDEVIRHLSPAGRTMLRHLVQSGEHAVFVHNAFVVCGTDALPVLCVLTDRSIRLVSHACLASTGDLLINTAAHEIVDMRAATHTALDDALDSPMPHRGPSGSPHFHEDSREASPGRSAFAWLGRAVTGLRSAVAGAMASAAGSHRLRRDPTDAAHADALRRTAKCQWSHGAGAKQSVMWTYNLRCVRDVQRCNFQHADAAVDLRMAMEKGVMVAFVDIGPKGRDAFVAELLRVHPALGSDPKLSTLLGGHAAHSVAELQARWVGGHLATRGYLEEVNRLARRTVRDWTQYPVFPFALCDFTSDALDMADPATFRDLAWPMGAQTPQRREVLQEHYAVAVAAEAEEPASDLTEYERFMTGPCHHATHYSVSAGLAYFLIRVQPFTNAHLALQRDRFDCADRLFSSLATSWRNALETTADCKEMVPDFLQSAAMLRNAAHLPLGTTQDGVTVGAVRLPPWAHGDPHRVVAALQAALEAPHVVGTLHHWLDLVFGVKQQGQAAVDAFNTFRPLSYSKNFRHALDAAAKRNDAAECDRAVTTVREFGQTPPALFDVAHPHRAPEHPPMAALVDPARRPDTVAAAAHRVERCRQIVSVAAGSAQAQAVQAALRELAPAATTRTRWFLAHCGVPHAWTVRHLEVVRPAPPPGFSLDGLPPTHLVRRSPTTVALGNAHCQLVGRSGGGFIFHWYHGAVLTRHATATGQCESALSFSPPCASPITATLFSALETFGFVATESGAIYALLQAPPSQHLGYHSQLLGHTHPVVGLQRFDKLNRLVSWTSAGDDGPIVWRFLRQRVACLHRLDVLAALRAAAEVMSPVGNAGSATVVSVAVNRLDSKLLVATRHAVVLFDTDGAAVGVAATVPLPDLRAALEGAASPAPQCAAITTVYACEFQDAPEGVHVFMTGHDDGTVRVWSYAFDAATTERHRIYAVRPMAGPEGPSVFGHGRAVACIRRDHLTLTFLVTRVDHTVEQWVPDDRLFPEVHALLSAPPL